MMRNRQIFFISLVIIVSVSLTACGDTMSDYGDGEVFELPAGSIPVSQNGAGRPSGSGAGLTETDGAETFDEDDGADYDIVPRGVKVVEDPVTGEKRYRLSDEDPDDPRTYTYDDMLQSELGEEAPEGLDQYDAQDVSPFHVTVSNPEALSDFYDDAYFVQNLKIFLANYLYYFTQDASAHYNAEIFGGEVHDTEKGTIVFDVVLDKYPGERIHCEYDPIRRLYGFESSIGDMSLGTQFAIASDGKAVSRETLLEYGHVETTEMSVSENKEE